jgi:tetratricopeptide (TPR) repeat protein
MIEESDRRSGHLNEAKAAFHDLITRYPDSAWTHYLIATAYENQQELDKALSEYKAAYERDASLPNVKFAIGYLYWRRQDSDDAREWLQKETATGCHPLAEYYLGEIAREKRNYPEAESLYGRSLQCDPSNANAHMRLGVVLGDQKRYKDATTQLLEAVHLNPSDEAAHYRLAVIYRKLGENVKAEAEYAIVRQIQAHTSQSSGTMGGNNP